MFFKYLHKQQEIKIKSLGNLIVYLFNDIVSKQQTIIDKFEGHNFRFTKIGEWNKDNPNLFYIYKVEVLNFTKSLKSDIKALKRYRYIYLYATIYVSDINNIFSINPDFIIASKRSDPPNINIIELLNRNIYDSIFIWDIDNVLKVQDKNKINIINNNKKTVNVNHDNSDDNDEISKLTDDFRKEMKKHFDKMDKLLDNNKEINDNEEDDE